MIIYIIYSESYSRHSGSATLHLQPAPPPPPREVTGAFFNLSVRVRTFYRAVKIWVFYLVSFSGGSNVKRVISQQQFGQLQKGYASLSWNGCYAVNYLNGRHEWEKRQSGFWRWNTRVMNDIKQLFETKPSAGVDKLRPSGRIRPMRALHSSRWGTVKIRLQHYF
jgi:hypothetical protein